MSCIFCDRSDDIPARIFYENKEAGWYALLSAPPHTRGHAILAACNRDGRCPQQFDRRTLGTIGVALSEVVQAIRKHYSVQEVLLTSIRRDIRHFHVHLLPVWPAEEARWRSVTGYAKSHLMEFIGSLEKRRDFLVSERALRKGQSEEAQRQEATQKLLPEIRALRKQVRYKPEGRKKRLGLAR